ncbi:carbonic anhydrase [Pseudomonas sp. RIT288]|uniref:carbonic anhydrase n=1 Tax=Pseudomonas sp. RIT288 TaxID=1470589 RepID=UPI00044F5B35|nr:carbonic anhydrase family protein [Pseudomonas sp. RIT288]EZP32980.1 carbonate dehydratase [Pseudomonas sp. RIT288]
MSVFIRPFYLIVPLCFSLASQHSHGADWNYHGAHGPAHWGMLGSELCAQGEQQSPIDVELKKIHPLAGSASDLKISYGAMSLDVVNNGHSIQANVGDVETVTFKGREYRLVQFHFHTPSEHQIDHVSYPMEMHLVNQDSDGRLLVIGLFVKEGKNNRELASLWKRLPDHENQTLTLSAKDAPDLGSLVPAASHHVFYKGSLTTPPCTEGVQWVLFEQPIEMSKTQIRKIRQLFPDNHRPSQPLNEREVDED